MTKNIVIGPNEAVAMDKAVDAQMRGNPTGKFFNFEILFICIFV
jgi:hypothetical protein